jgi:poly(3-hydroxybutyrate) depolymerase
MRWRALRITILFALTIAPLYCVRADKVEIDVDGQRRSYVIDRPTIAGPRPTVIMLHGINGTAEQIARRTGLDQAGPRQGFVVVFPQSRGNAWNRFLPGNETARAREYFRNAGGPPN